MTTDKHYFGKLYMCLHAERNIETPPPSPTHPLGHGVFCVRWVRLFVNTKVCSIALFFSLSCWLYFYM